MNPFQVLALVVIAAFGIVVLTSLTLMLSLFRLWVRALASGARISLPELVMMQLRKTPADEVVRLRILAVQNGVDISTVQIERAYLAGADVARAVLAMAHAKQHGENVSWDDLMHADTEERLSRR